MQQYVQGEVAALAVAFSGSLATGPIQVTVNATGEVIRNVPGPVVDPATVALKVQDGSGAVTTYTFGQGTIQKDAAGVYYALIPLAVSGTWVYSWVGDANTIAAKPGWGSFQVVPAPL